MSIKTELSAPKSQDGYAVNQLIGRCTPLDENSVYCNLLQCDHFAQTSVIAKKDVRVVGFISGYRLPERLNALFVWQVAVDQSERGTGLATKMLMSLLERSSMEGVSMLETTITKDNVGSWALFTRLAERLKAPIEKSPHYESEAHFNNVHDTEWLVRIGPF